MRGNDRNSKGRVGPHVGRFHRSRRGASTVEQALFIALVIGATLAAIEGLGFVSHATFFTVARGMHGDSGESIAAPGASASSPDGSERRAASADAFRDPLLPSRFLLLLIACPFGAVCWYLLYRDSRKRRAETPGELVAALPPAVEEDAVFVKRHELLRSFSGDVGIFFTSRMRVRQVMTRGVQWVLPSATLADVRQLMREKKIRHLLVCDKHEHLLGVISDRNLHSTTARVAKEVMVDDPLSVEPDSLVNPAVTLMLQKRISCLPVVEKRCVVGVVTSTDLLMALQCTLHALQRVGAEAVANLPPDTVPGFMLAALEELDEAPLA